MAWDVMILMGTISIRGLLEGMGPENRYFLGPKMATAKRVPTIWTKKIIKSKLYRI